MASAVGLQRAVPAEAAVLPQCCRRCWQGGTGGAPRGQHLGLRRRVGVLLLLLLLLRRVCASADREHAHVAAQPVLGREHRGRRQRHVRAVFGRLDAKRELAWLLWVRFGVELELALGAEGGAGPDARDLRAQVLLLLAGEGRVRAHVGAQVAREELAWRVRGERPQLFGGGAEAGCWGHGQLPSGARPALWGAWASPELSGAPGEAEGGGVAARFGPGGRARFNQSARGSSWRPRAALA